MGRRARTHCSPVDSVLEKYHNDIGNRLSGVFIPPHQHPAPNNNNNNEESALCEACECDAFNMLTLDFRGHHSIKQNKIVQQDSQTSTATSHQADTSSNFNDSGIHDDSGTESSKDDSAFDHPPKHSDTLSSLDSHIMAASNLSSVKEKRNLVDKLTRALFQRKHTCARCQRRSKSCLQNKTFNVNEKHYTCARCRESSRAIKNFVSGKENITATNDTTRNNADIILPKPRVQLKDSGYETVTSCSTVASGHSNSNSPYASSSKLAVHATSNENKLCENVRETTAPCSRVPTGDEEDVGIIRNDNTDTPTSAHHVSGHGGHGGQGGQCACNGGCTSDPTTTTTTTQSSYVNTTNIGHLGLDHFMGVVGDDGVRVLKQVKTRYVQDYDGYLPVSDVHSCDVIHQAPINDTPNQQHISQQQQQQPQQQLFHKNTTHQVCHVCSTTSRPCFRLPWEGGWLCEDCIDGML